VNSVRQLATRRPCPLDRVQTITLICTSLPNSTYRGISAARFFAKQLAILDYIASRVLQVEVNSPRLLRRVLRIFHNGFVGAHQSVFDMTNGKSLVGARAGVELWISRASIRARLRSEFMRRASALVSVCIARTRYLKPDSHFHPPTMLHFLSPAEWRLPPPHTQLRSTPPGRSKPSVYGPMAARSVGSVGKSSGSRTSCRACSDVSLWSAEYKSTSPSDGRSVKIPFSGTAVFFWSDS